MDLDSIRIDSKAIEGGQWVKNRPGFGNLELRVRGAGSIAYRQALSRHAREAPQEDRDGDGRLTEEGWARVAALAEADTAILDWRNLELGGKKAPFSAALARSLMLDDSYRLFREMVQFAAAEIARNAAGAKEADEASLGKSRTRSTGTGTGRRARSTSGSSTPKTASRSRTT